MKRVVSISLGSSKRNHQAEIEMLGQKILIERIGTDGNMQKAMALISEFDGKVDCFGLGGIDLYIYAGSRRYTIKDAARIVAKAKKTPIFDGSGLKNTLERRAIMYLNSIKGIEFKNSKVLLVSGADRFGMAETFEKLGAKLTCGDLIFALGLPIPLHSLKALDRVARIIAPIVMRLPFRYIYPTGTQQETTTQNNKYHDYYYQADYIAGDYHFIKKYMPEDLRGKILITNTVTKEDIIEMKRRGVSLLATTTPNIEGRSFGTNVLEAALVAISGSKSAELTPMEYMELLDTLQLTPYMKWLQESSVDDFVFMDEGTG
jgi:hypothetical protein